MGGKSSKPKSVILSQRMNMGGCRSDLDCQNPDAARSSPDTGLVLSCPDAVCLGADSKGNGQCKCGSKCKLDKYSGTCCQDIINIRGDQFCIEYTEPPKNPAMRKGLECKAREQVFVQDGKKVVIPAQQICEWCAQSVVDTVPETEAPVTTEGFASVDVLNSFMY